MRNRRLRAPRNIKLPSAVHVVRAHRYRLYKVNITIWPYMETHKLLREKSKLFFVLTIVHMPPAGRPLVPPRRARLAIGAFPPLAGRQNPYTLQTIA
jgi:hypothetical protein